MSTPHILIVEDDPKSRKLLRDVLGAVGYKTSEADNAEDGIKIAQASIPDLILMDIRLPGMSGIDALHLLRNDTKTSAIPIVAVTASVMLAQQAEAQDAGFDAVEYKPVNMQSLLGIIRKFIARNPLSETT
jgi:two-component system cell cycle response regulator DivK